MLTRKYLSRVIWVKQQEINRMISLRTRLKLLHNIRLRKQSSTSQKTIIRRMLSIQSGLRESTFILRGVAMALAALTVSGLVWLANRLGAEGRCKKKLAKKIDAKQIKTEGADERTVITPLDDLQLAYAVKSLKKESMSWEVRTRSNFPQKDPTELEDTEDYQPRFVIDLSELSRIYQEDILNLTIIEPGATFGEAKAFLESKTPSLSLETTFDHSLTFNLCYCLDESLQKSLNDRLFALSAGPIDQRSLKFTKKWPFLAKVRPNFKRICADNDNQFLYAHVFS